MPDLRASFSPFVTQILQVFYEKLADIKEYHRKFSSVTYETGATDAALFDPQEFLSSCFSGDEVFGKCVGCKCHFPIIQCSISLL